MGHFARIIVNVNLVLFSLQVPLMVLSVHLHHSFQFSHFRRATPCFEQLPLGKELHPFPGERISEIFEYYIFSAVYLKDSFQEYFRKTGEPHCSQEIMQSELKLTLPYFSS